MLSDAQNAVVECTKPWGVQLFNADVVLVSVSTVFSLWTLAWAIALTRRLLPPCEHNGANYQAENVPTKPSTRNFMRLG